MIAMPCALAGCSHDKEEAAALVHAIDVYRAAPDSDKVAAVDKIKAVTVTNLEISEAKDECLQMAEPTANALAAKIAAAKVLDDLKKDAAVPEDVSALPDRLDAASKLLDVGHEHLIPCEEKLTGLRIKYRL